MCRLIAYASRSATTLERLIGPEQCSRFRRLTELHADGWGTAQLEAIGDMVRRQREVSTSGEGLARAMASSPTVARTIHLRMATCGMGSAVENTHPFLADGLGFSHNGAISPVAPLRALVTPDGLADVHGETDSELYFALIRQRLSLGVSLLDATCAVVSALRSLFPRASLNAFVLAADELIVVHSSESAAVPEDDFALRGFVGSGVPAGHGPEYYQLFRRTTAVDVLFASTGLDVSGWEPVAPETVTRVCLRTLNIETRSLSRHERIESHVRRSGRSTTEPTEQAR